MIYRRRLGLAGLALALGLAATAWVAGPARAAPGDLPPRPEPASPAAAGALIQLQVPAGQAGLWTVVQWQDALGGWHPVEGWRGTLDTVHQGTGVKTWWVAPEHLGTGPFRWVAYPDERSNVALAASEPFHLPAAASRKMVIGLARP